MRDDKYTEASGWQVVRNRKAARSQFRSHRRMDVARSHRYYPKEASRQTFFFTNFPENFFAKHMLSAFLKYGEFEEVVIPAKRDKRGLRFGFARAVNVRDPKSFAVKLDNIIIGRDKIMVNLPRFGRISDSNPPRQTTHIPSSSHPPVRPQKPFPIPISHPNTLASDTDSTNTKKTCLGNPHSLT